LPSLQTFEDVNKRTSGLAVKQNLVPPNVFRLHYRQALSDVVGAWSERQGAKP
jgi:hypothetical protein